MIVLYVVVCFGCLVFKYFFFFFSAELYCFYRVLRVQYVMGQLLETPYIKGILVYTTRIHSSKTPAKHFGKVFALLALHIQLSDVYKMAATADQATDLPLSGVLFQWC